VSICDTNDKPSSEARIKHELEIVAKASLLERRKRGDVEYNEHLTQIKP